jgi:hypothetical protein
MVAHQRHAHRLMIVLDGLDAPSAFFAVRGSALPPWLVLRTAFGLIERRTLFLAGCSLVVGGRLTLRCARRWAFAGSGRRTCRARDPSSTNLDRRGHLVRETLGSIAPDGSSASPSESLSYIAHHSLWVCRRLPETRGLMAAAELVAPLHDGVFYSGDYLGTLARAHASSPVGSTFYLGL